MNLENYTLLAISLNRTRRDHWDLDVTVRGGTDGRDRETNPFERGVSGGRSVR